MKYDILIISFIVLSCAFCYPSNDNKADSINVRYEVCGGDTVFYKTYSNTITCGLKQYETDHYAKIRKEQYDVGFRELQYKMNNDEGVKDFYLYIAERLLKGYGKERCMELVKVYENSAPKISVYLCIDTTGNIIDVNFNYSKSCAEFMTCADVVRNTKIIIDSTPVPYFGEYAELGVKILPPLQIPILISFIEQYLEKE